MACEHCSKEIVEVIRYYEELRRRMPELRRLTLSQVMLQAAKSLIASEKQ